MRYHNPLEFLTGAAAAGRLVNAFSRRASFLVAPALAMLVASAASGKPPQAPPVQSGPPKFAWAVTSRAAACTNCPCGLDDCPCGCCDGKACACRKARVDELAKPYAARWRAEGWTWSEAGGYWFKYPDPEPAPTRQYFPQLQPAVQSFAPAFQPSFGGFGGGRGGC